MKIKSIFLMMGAAIAGIYLTSEEGKKAREALRKKRSVIEPIIKDLLKQANEVLEGSKQIDSTKLKLNVEKLIGEAKKTLLNIELDKVIDTSKEAIKVATRKINEASNDIKKAKRKIAPKKRTINKKEKQVTKTGGVLKTTKSK